jgi:hypothetical protein
MRLIDKIRKARETGVEIEGHAFTIRRPTDEEAQRFARDNASVLEIVKRFTIGWDLTELELIPGGGPEAVPFDAALFAEWISDQPRLWDPLGNAILQAYQTHIDKRDDAVKN